MRASTSAQDTVLGHADWSLSLTRCTAPKPRRLLLGGASFSAGLLAASVESISTEASHPRTKQSWKWRRRKGPASVGASLRIPSISCLTISSTCGHVLL
ncbi:hypothetical protein CFC21_029745 [Triticum aestivum]|uniref:Uncharacterized protein n=2 Tax=Triticum aestivum TaxID=4565 RepID=A0A9R1ETK3_WHEAT|nr:hypothetical protein CFC21_029745 [Triticum aestivum]